MKNRLKLEVLQKLYNEKYIALKDLGKEIADLKEELEDLQVLNLVEEKTLPGKLDKKTNSFRLGYRNADGVPSIIGYKVINNMTDLYNEYCDSELVPNHPPNYE